MTNKFIAFIALCCCSMAISAQQTDKSDKIRFGVKGGVNISNMHYSNLEGQDAGGITSGMGGIFAEFDLGVNRKFSIRPELLFLNRGSEVNGTDAYGDDFNYNLKAKYTDIRIPVIYNFCNSEKISPYVYLAPIFSFTRGGEINYNTYVMDEPMPWPTLDITNANFSKFDFSAAAGIGIRIPLKIADTKKIYFAMEANYQYGFIDTYGSKEQNGSAISLNRNIYNITGSRKNRSFEISASVSVPLSIFKKTNKKKTAPTYIPATVVEKEPEPVKEKVAEKPCYTLDEIMQLLSENKSITGKTICAIEQINFAFGKSDISKNSFGYLDKIVLLLQQSDIKMEIKGHSDNVGNADFNLELSKKRAMAVYSYLIKKGVSADRLSYSYYGMSKPITSNDTEEGRKINRRVEFEILK